MPTPNLPPVLPLSPSLSLSSSPSLAAFLHFSFTHSLISQSELANVSLWNFFSHVTPAFFWSLNKKECWVRGDEDWARQKQSCFCVLYSEWSWPIPTLVHVTPNAGIYLLPFLRLSPGQWSRTSQVWMCTGTEVSGMPPLDSSFRSWPFKPRVLDACMKI